MIIQELLINGYGWQTQNTGKRLTRLLCHWPMICTIVAGCYFWGLAHWACFTSTLSYACCKVLFASFFALRKTCRNWCLSK